MMAHDSVTVEEINASVSRYQARVNWDSAIAAPAGPNLPDPRPTLAQVTAATIRPDSAPILFFGEVMDVLRLGGDSVQVRLSSLFYRGRTQLQIRYSESVVPKWPRTSNLDDVGGLAVVAAINGVLEAATDSGSPSFVLVGGCLAAHQLSFVQGIQPYWAPWQRTGFQPGWQPAARGR
jgi:hypothetical protein